MRQVGWFRNAFKYKPATRHYLVRSAAIVSWENRPRWMYFGLLYSRPLLRVPNFFVVWWRMIRMDRNLRLTFVLCAAAACAVAGGCVQRRMTIRTNPPGAQVYVDDQEIGRTPVSTDFIYYGKRKIRLVKDGYETLTVTQPIHPPWYEYPVLEFISENVVPWEIRDERGFDFQMQPAMVVPSQALLARAEELRSSQVAVPVAPVMMSVPPAAGQPPVGVTSPYAVPTQPAPLQPTPLQPAPLQPMQPPAQPGMQYVPPPAILNYPPAVEAGPQPTLQAPQNGYAPAPYVPPTQYPGDFGGRPVPSLP